MYFERLSMLPKLTNMCFLDCDYCMVSDELTIDKKTQRPTDIFPLETLEEMMDKSLGFGQWFFSYLGGEPLMCGKEYFREMFDLINKKSKELRIPFTHRVTTNGLLLDDEWIALFKEYNCKIFVSWDGLGFGKKGSKKAYSILKQYANDIQVVSAVVTKENTHALTDIYKSVSDIGVKRFAVQYNIYENKDTFIQMGKDTVKLFQYIDGLKERNEPVPCNFFSYNDAKAIARGKYMSINGNEFTIHSILGDYVIDTDGTVRCGLPESKDDYAVLGNIKDVKHWNDFIFQDKMKKILDDFVSSMHSIEYPEVSLVTHGGGYFFDKKDIWPMDKPFTPRLACYHEMVDYFRK